MTFRFRLAMFEDRMKEPLAWLLVSDGNGFEAPAHAFPAVKGRWHHMAGTADLSKRSIHFYLDGRLLGEHTVSKERLHDGGGPLVIGASMDSRGEPWLGLLDEVRVYDRALSPEEIALIASPLRVSCAALVDSFDTDKTVPKTIASVGGAVAADRSFDASLEAMLGGEYSFAGKLGLAGKRKTIRDALRGLSGRLAREKPEVVRVCFGATALAKGRTAEQVRPDMARLVADVAHSGAVCVLYTLPVARPDDDESRRVIEDYNVMVRDMSFEAGVLLIDAYEILNRNLSGGATHFAKGRLQTSGYEALNDEFLRTYRLLERVVMRRDVAVPPLRGTQAVADASNAPDGSAAGVGGASPTKPDAPLATAPGALSLLVNGGFEDADAETRFAAAWQPYPVGAQRAGRLDQSHPHGGDRALVIRLAAGRQERGAYTTLSLEPGTYVLRYWACSDVGATARVSVHVAGRECTPDALDEDWRQFSHTVLVEEKLANTSVRICSVTPSVRVWLDDVELTRVRSERP